MLGHTPVFHNVQDVAISGDIFRPIYVSQKCIPFSCRSTLPSNTCIFKVACTQRKSRVIPNSGSVVITLEERLVWYAKIRCVLGSIFFAVENKLENHSYFKLLAVKAADVEDVKPLSQYLSPVAEQFIIQLAATYE